MTFNDIKYGWKIPAGIVLAAVSIFTALNVRERINQTDVIEIVLGTYERCLATKGPAGYAVAPPSFVRVWTITGQTVSVTNTIGWRVDKEMLADCDAVIRALVTNYLDTATLTSGVESLAMLTVTGLWARLAIGDGTNQFTREGYGSRIRASDLAERYKVLNALSALPSTVSWGGTNRYSLLYDYPNTWDGAKALAEEYWPDEKSSAVFPEVYTVGFKAGSVYAAQAWNTMGRVGSAAVTATSMPHRTTFYVYAVATNFYFDIFGIYSLTVTNGANLTFDGNGDITGPGWQAFHVGDWTNAAAITSAPMGSTNVPTWCDAPDSGPTEDIEGTPVYARARGYRVTDSRAVTEFAFIYATNKYW